MRDLALFTLKGCNLRYMTTDWLKVWKLNECGMGFGGFFIGAKDAWDFPGTWAAYCCRQWVITWCRIQPARNGHRFLLGKGMDIHPFRSWRRLTWFTILAALLELIRSQKSGVAPNRSSYTGVSFIALFSITFIVGFLWTPQVTELRQPPNSYAASSYTPERTWIT